MTLSTKFSGKLLHLDVLRGVAILLVFGYHWHITNVDDYVSHNGRVLSFTAVSWEQLYASFSPLNYGSTGVQLFLVISGFLIHYNYLNKYRDKWSLKEYYSRRFWRIYPPYLLILFFFAFYNKEQTIYHLLTPEGRTSLIAHIFAVHNLSGENQIFFGINPSFWSIALELQLYLIYPFFLLLARRFGIFRLCKGLMVVHVLALLGLILVKGTLPDKLAEVTFVGHYWIVWALGALVAEAHYNKRRVFRISWGGWWLLLFVFFCLQIFLFFFLYFSGVMIALLWAMLVELYINKPLSPNRFHVFSREALITIGLCSYSMYLVHQPVMNWLLNFIDWGDSSRFTNSVNGLIVFAIIFFISWSLYVFVEKPSVRLGQKLNSWGGSK